MPKHFRRRTLQDGIVQVFETDSDADYVRHLIDELAKDFGLVCGIAVVQRPRGWLVVQIIKNAAVDRDARISFEQFVDELNRIFSSFYDCAESTFVGPASGWRLRHRPGRRWI